MRCCSGTGSLLFGYRIVQGCVFNPDLCDLRKLLQSVGSGVGLILRVMSGISSPLRLDLTDIQDFHLPPGECACGGGARGCAQTRSRFLWKAFAGLHSMNVVGDEYVHRTRIPKHKLKYTKAKVPQETQDTD